MGRFASQAPHATARLAHRARPVRRARRHMRTRSRAGSCLGHRGDARAGFEKTFGHSEPGLVPADCTRFATLAFCVHRSEGEARARASTTIELQFVEEQGVRCWRELTVD